MSVNVDQLFGQMLTSGAQAFGAGWGEVERFAKLEFKTLAQRIKDIGDGLAQGRFDLPTAKLLTAMQVAGLLALTARGAGAQQPITWTGGVVGGGWDAISHGMAEPIREKAGLAIRVVPGPLLGAWPRGRNPVRSVMMRRGQPDGRSERRPPWLMTVTRMNPAGHSTAATFWEFRAALPAPS